MIVSVATKSTKLHIVLIHSAEHKQIRESTCLFLMIFAVLSPNFYGSSRASREWFSAFRRKKWE